MGLQIALQRDDQRHPAQERLPVDVDVHVEVAELDVDRRDVIGNPLRHVRPRLPVQGVDANDRAGRTVDPGA